MDSERRIWKFPLELASHQVVTVRDALFEAPLHVGLDPGGQICLWALVDLKTQAVSAFTARVVGTGWPTPEKASDYVGTVHDRGLVWHVFVGERIRIGGSR